MDIIMYLIQLIQYQHKQICWLLNFICRYIPFIRQDWQFLLEYYQWKYGKPVKPVQRRNGKSIPEDTICPLCGAPHHYIYREFTVDFFAMDLNSLPKNASSLKFSKHNAHVMSLCLTLHINLDLSLRKTSQALKNLYNISISHQQFAKKFKDNFTFNITQVIGLTNDDEVSKKFRPYKQMIERLNRTYKASYRPTNGFDNYDGANYDLALWVAYYNFLRPHKHTNYTPLNKMDMLANAENMPGKWQLLIFLGQQTILNLQNGEATVCS